MNADVEKEQKLSTYYTNEKLLNIFDTENTEKNQKFTEILSDTFYENILNEVFSQGFWSNIESAKLVLSSFTIIENLNTFDSLIDSNILEKLPSVIFCTEEKDTQSILVNIYIALCRFNPEKYVFSSLNMIYNGMDENQLNIINYGIVSLHTILKNISSIPDPCLTDEFKERIVYLFMNMTRPFILTNVLQLMNDLLIKQNNQIPLDLFDFNRIVYLCSLNTKNVQVKALQLLFTYLNFLPEIGNLKNLLYLMKEIIIGASFPSKVLAMKCFYTLMEYDKEMSLVFIKDELIDTLINSIHSFDDAGITAMSILLRVMQICQNDDQFLSEYASILSSESSIEALQNVIENSNSLMAQQAQQILSFIDRLEEI